MNLAELTQTKGWKNFMAKLYGIGASVVIIGALFKILHWPGANYMLMAGLGTEAVIFFFSAFEPLHEEVDWSLVYPQLAGLEPDEPQVQTQAVQQSAGPSVSIFDEKLLESAENAPELFEKLTTGLQNLSDTTEKLSDISDASVATNKFTENMNSAADSVNELGSATKQSAETLSYSVDGVSDAYNKVSDQVKESGNQVENAYQKLIESMTVDVDFSAVNQGNESYNEKITVLNKNLEALNAVFELQLEGGLDQMMEDLKGSVEQSQRYKEQVSQLADNVESLNRVYGNMLSAMKMND